MAIDQRPLSTGSRPLPSRTGCDKLGYVITLPYETKWERAARGTSGLIYPWGNKYRSGYANVDETENNEAPHYLQQTTPVGIYPHAQSPEGVQDLAGNVWEWCMNDYSKPTEITYGPDSAVLQGGSWSDLPRLSRSAYKFKYDPVRRQDYIGFRLLRSPRS